MDGRCQKLTTTPPPADRTADQILADRSAQHDEVFEDQPPHTGGPVAQADGLLLKEQDRELPKQLGGEEGGKTGDGTSGISSPAAASLPSLDDFNTSSSVVGGLASYFGYPDVAAGDGVPLGSPQFQVPPVQPNLGLLNQESRYPSLPLLYHDGPASGPTSLEAAARCDDAVAFSLPSSPLYSTAIRRDGIVGGGAGPALSHPHAFMPITPAPPQGSSQTASIIAAPTPVLLATASSPIVISPPQQSATIPAAYSPVMSPGILNTAFAPANPLSYPAGAPFSALLPTGVVSLPSPQVEPEVVDPSREVI